MRYTARRRYIAWRDDPDTRDAAAFTTDMLASGEPFVFRHKLEPGQGIICNNVLHARAGFRRGALARRNERASAVPDPPSGPNRRDRASRWAGPAVTGRTTMVQLSELIIRHPEVQCFDDLVKLVAKTGKEGERFLEFDVKPDYRDTPAPVGAEAGDAFYWVTRSERRGRSRGWRGSRLPTGARSRSTMWSLRAACDCSASPFAKDAGSRSSTSMRRPRPIGGRH